MAYQREGCIDCQIIDITQNQWNVIYLYWRIIKKVDLFQFKDDMTYKINIDSIGGFITAVCDAAGTLEERFRAVEEIVALLKDNEFSNVIFDVSSMERKLSDDDKMGSN